MRWFPLCVLLAMACSTSPEARDEQNTEVEGPQLIASTGEMLKAAIEAPGAEVVLVNMWASWCPPCAEEFPALLQIEERYRERGVRLVLVSVDEDPADAEAFLASQGVDFDTYHMGQEARPFVLASELPWSGALPATFFYNSKGVQLKFEGAANASMFEAMLEEVLALE